MVVAFNRLWLSEEATPLTDGGDDVVASYYTRARIKCPKGE
jgi:hypothetical protein